MTRIVLSLFIAAMLASSANAQLFGRRGCSTGHCAPAVYHAPAIVKQPDFIQQLFFISQDPGYLAPRGTVDYRSLATALDVTAASDRDYLNNSNLHIGAAENSTRAATVVGEGLRSIVARQADTNNVIAKGEAAANLVRAFAGETETTGSSRSIVLTLKNGVYESVREIKPEPELPPPLPRAFDSGLSCSKCHSAGGDGSEKFLIDGPLSLDQFVKAEEAINSGAMPPKSNLTKSEKASLKLRLGKLVVQ